MKRAFALVLVLLAARAASAQSELRVTIHIRMHPLAGATDQGLPVPASEGDTVSIVGNGAVRTETLAASGQPAFVTITQPDRTLLLEPETKTFFVTPVPPAGALAPGGRTSFARTGEFDTIAGVRAERVLFTLDFDLPANDFAPARTASMTGEMWLTDKFAAYNVGVGQGIATFSFLRGEKARPSGFTMKTIIRGGIIGANEMQATITSAVEEPLRPELFAPPPDYRERALTLDR